MSTPALLPRPELRRPALALAGYALFTVTPFALTLLGLAGLSRLSGEAFRYGLVLIAVVALRQLNVFVVSTLYHRSITHRAFRFHPALEWPLRLWGWIFLGAGTRTWALVHRKHHQYADSAEDPHSPTKPGGSFANIGRQSLATFLAAGKDLSPYARYDKGLPWDRLERLIRWDEEHVYGVRGLRIPFMIALLSALYALGGHSLGVALAAGVLTLPSTNGSVLAATIMIVNGVGHTVGYRNYALRDSSTNLFPVDLLGWGEALHNNHHARPACADMAAQPWEWDPGFAALALLERLGLVRDLRRR
ncbi:MAG: fatty acid desaturase [Alphaproteobacteria bacterium]|nr:fatty acid desaturase [Alphaproteobacteria bacterium]MCB9797668.1 fatty acid desaturase [Alphaproteobacteria bacterium]